MLFREIIAVYSENYMKPINTSAELLTVKEEGTCSYHSALKVLIWVLTCILNIS
jgi:hypothetical protein